MQIGRDKTVTIQVDMKPNMENPKSSTQKLLELINLARQQDTTSKNRLHFFYTNNEISKRECKQSLKIASKKCLGTNLTKEVKDFYVENCKTVIKEIEDDSKK